MLPEDGGRGGLSPPKAPLLPGWHCPSLPPETAKASGSWPRLRPIQKTSPKGKLPNCCFLTQMQKLTGWFFGTAGYIGMVWGKRGWLKREGARRTWKDLWKEGLDVAHFMGEISHYIAEVHCRPTSSWPILQKSAAFPFLKLQKLLLLLLDMNQKAFVQIRRTLRSPLLI